MNDHDTAEARFAIGELVHHKRFDYRGVVVDVDPTFQGTEEWYARMALSKPPRSAPWYRVLVHQPPGERPFETYVAERNLETDPSRSPIEHPALGLYFEQFADGRYARRRPTN